MVWGQVGPSFDGTISVLSFDRNNILHVFHDSKFFKLNQDIWDQVGGDISGITTNVFFREDNTPFLRLVVPG